MHCTALILHLKMNLNINALKLIEEKFKCPIGYSDHSMGIEAAICATSIGAKVIEKHITLDKEMVGPDHSAASIQANSKRWLKVSENVKLSLVIKRKKYRNQK